MGITTLLFFVLARNKWGWSTAKALGVCIPFAVLDLGFFGANVFKIPSGGWFPIAVALVIIMMMTTWRTGRRAVGERLDAGATEIGEFLAELPEDLIRVRAPRCSSTAARGWHRPPCGPTRRTTTRCTRRCCWWRSTSVPRHTAQDLRSRSNTSDAESTRWC
ncbi:MAG: KUP/HAK/KT family potassium transporter [Microthrixaceae bacterium]